MDCHNHAGTGSVTTCIACQQPICADCREEVAGHAMCHPCVAAAQERLAAAPAAAPVPPAPAAEQPPLRCGFVHYVRAVLFAGIAAIVGAVAWDKFALITGIQLGLVAVALGVLVGVAVVRGADGRRGALLPWIGAPMAGFSILLGYALLAQDMLAREHAQQASKFLALPWIIRIPFLIFATVQSLDLMDWVFVAIGVWEGWSIPRRMLRRASEPTAPAPASSEDSTAVWQPASGAGEEMVKAP
jgi:hypothetical protein